MVWSHALGLSSAPSFGRLHRFIMSMFVRIKREKVTYFIHANPEDPVAHLKQEVCGALGWVGWCTRPVFTPGKSYP